MPKRLKKTISIFVLALTFLLSSSVVGLAAEKEVHIYTESMEIRSEGKTGLRIVSTIDRTYYEQLIKSGKKITYGTVAVPASALEADGKELVIGGSYKFNGKSYKALNIPAERNWNVTDSKIYFTGVLTGISGAGFNTRYTARSYITVDGKTTYGNTLTQSSYITAQKMLESAETTSENRGWLAKNIIDACDDAKKVTQQTLTITSANVKNGKCTLEPTTKVRNYKNVVVDGSVQNAEIIFNNLRVRNLEVSESANCTITANSTVFDTISKKTSIGRNAGNLILNLGNGTSVSKLSAASNLTVNGTLKIAEIVVDKTIENFVVNAPTEKLNVLEQASGSDITVNSTVDNAVLNGENSTIGGNGKLDKVQDNGNNKVDVEIGEDLLANEILSVEVRGMNRMIVTLKKSTEKVLTADDMEILCHGGKDMTILKAETTDRKVYTVTTSIFAKDSTYTFSMEVEPGKIIQKKFSYKVDCPTVSNATVLRSEATRAEFDLFDVDEGGYVYVYIPGHTQISRDVSGMPSVEMVKKGYRQQIKTGFNKVIIKGLEEGNSYPLYYVMEAFDGRTSDVLGPVQISGNIEEDPNISSVYKIVEVGENPQNTITIKLNKAPDETLTLNNFSFICPSDSEITIDKATLKVSEDRCKYTIIIPDNYNHKDNQYTAKITFSDGTVAKKTFVSHFEPPSTTAHKVERIAENKIRYSFTSDEEGVFYIGTYNFNGDYASGNNTPTGKDIIDGVVVTTKKQMYAGNNEIEIEYNGKDKDWFAIHVDKYGNYRKFTEHGKIPAYVPPKPEESELEIESIVYNKDNSDSMSTCLDITFTTAIDETPAQSLIKFSVISGGGSLGKLLLERSFLDTEQKVLRIRSMNAAFKPGTYELSMYVYKDGILKQVKKQFVID